MTMPKEALNTYLKDYLVKLNIDRFILSVSGGVDSMVMLHAYTHHKPHVVYFNHNKREDSHLDQQLVVSYCETHQLNYDVFSLDVPNQNFHHEAHLLRQHHLIEVSRKHNNIPVFTAHHLDDQKETVLMRILRGSDLGGYSGLKETNTIEDVSFHKPLLSYSKKEIILYAKDNHVSFLEDSSNTEDTYLRNRIRHHVIPFFEGENANFDDAILRYHTQLTAAYDFIKNYSENIPLASLSVSEMNAYPDAIKIQLIIRLFRLHSIQYTYAHIESVKLLLSKEPSNASLSLSDGKEFVVSYDKFFIEEKKINPKNAIILTNGHHTFDNKRVSIFFDNSQDIASSYIKVCYNKDALPLTLRYRKNGDILSFSYGHKKLKDFFIDKKIPLKNRDHLLVISDVNDTILWVENLYMNETTPCSNYVYIAQGEPDA